MANTEQAGREIRVGIYSRISDDRAKDEIKVEDQEARSRALCALEGWSVTQTYTDNSISAMDETKVRPAYEAMLLDVQAGRLDAVVCWNTDRLQRTTKDLIRLIDVGKPVGLNIRCVQGMSYNLSSSDGVLAAKLLTAVAEAEQNHKSERQKAANLSRAERGIPFKGPRRFGFNPDGTIKESEATYVRVIFDRFTAGGSISVLARWITKEGILSTRPGKDGWSRTAIRKMLQDERYIGTLRFKGEIVAKDLPAIVQRPIFDAAQILLERPTERASTSGGKRKYLGTGVYQCGVCDRPMITHHNGMKTMAYCCKTPGHMSRTGYLIDAVVIPLIVERLRSDEVREQFAHDQDSQAAIALRLQAVELQNKLDRYLADYAAGELSALERNVIRKPVEAELLTVNRQLADLGRSSALAEILGASDPGRYWLEHPDIWIRAKVLAELCTVTLQPVARGALFASDSLTIVWRGETATP